MLLWKKIKKHNEGFGIDKEISHNISLFVAKGTAEIQRGKRLECREEMKTQAFFCKENEVVDNYKAITYCLIIGLGKNICKNFAVKQMKGKVEVRTLSLLKSKLAH